MSEHSTAFPDCFHRVTVKGLCVREGKVLLALESKELSGEWEIPGGGLDFGEDIKEGLRREIQEEMGLKVTKISDRPVYVWTHKFESNRRKIGWYYSLALAYRIELESLEFTPSDECVDLQFFSKEEMGKVRLNQQTNELFGLFDPKDFEEPF